MQRLAWADEVKKIGLAVPNLQADYFNQIKLGVEGYAAKLGIEVITVDAKNDTNTQVSQVQDLLTQGIDAFIYIPAGAAAAAVPTRLARSEGVPVINVDREPEGEPGDTVIYGENIVVCIPGLLSPHRSCRWQRQNGHHSRPEGYHA